MKCPIYIPKIGILGRLFVCWHIISRHRTTGVLQTLHRAWMFLSTGLWPGDCWYYRSFLLCKLGHKGQADDIKEIFDLHIYGLDTVSPAPVIVDIGASVGDTLMYFVKKYPEATLYAFEPNPKMFALIRQNLAHVDTSCATIHLYNKAVSHTGKKRVDFYLAADTLTPSWSSTLRKVLSPADVKRRCSVASVSFASVMKKAGVIDLLKIDIEGGEYDLIPDMLRFRGRIKSFVMEMHNFGTIAQRRATYRAMHALSSAYALYIKPDYYHTMVHVGFDSHTEFPGKLPDRFGFVLYGKILKNK